ncbi:hypothetical protein, partial [Nitrolancea hollandica]|uniref:hypothetical protein n=1 Tax=Nitrolancea hollandica TaxID=1206749 RepID=UPI00058CA515
MSTPLDQLLAQREQRERARQAYVAGVLAGIRDRQQTPAPIPFGPAPQTPQAPTQTATPPKPEDPENPIIGAGKAALHGVGTVLDVGNKYVTRPVVGTVAKALAGSGVIGGERGQAIREADSFTGAEQALFEGHPWIKFLVEAGLDPLNLVGVGIPAKLLKGVEAGSTAAKALQTAQVADDVAGRVMALPVTIPLAGAKKAIATETGQKLFGPSKLGQLNKGVRGFSRALGNAARAGVEITPDLNLSEQALQMKTADVVNRVTSDPGSIGSLEAVPLARAYRELSATNPAAAAPIKAELSKRGLMTGQKLSAALDAHLQLEDTYDILGKDSPQERALGHQILDLTAKAMRESNPKTFRSDEDAYKLINVKAMVEPSQATGA